MTKKDYKTKKELPSSIVRNKIEKHVEDFQPYRDMRINKGGRKNKFKHKYF